MKRFSDISSQIGARAGSVKSLVAFAERMAARAPKEDERCAKCRDVGFYYPDPNDPDRGVKVCDESECRERRRQSVN